MKKAKLLGALLCSASLVLGSAVPAMADGTRVVTLGADLSESQKQTMLKYFKAPQQVNIITVTNQDERNHLGSYVPMEQIGNRTVSCAYVNPTSSGGIKVRTANLNWVTCNMIASTLSTSGVKNCEVVAACPFEVSGTGALTGIQMAYETASGVKLSETKKKIATQEMVVTGKLADRVGKKPATKVINQAKMEVIGNNITNSGDIYNVVVNIVQENNVNIGEAEIEIITGLMEEIAEEDYEYEDVQETLERVDENVSPQEEGEDSEESGSLLSDLIEKVLPNGDAENEETPDDEDNGILDEIDSDILDGAVEDSTQDPELAVETGMTGLDESDETIDPDAEWGLMVNDDGEIVDTGAADDTQIWDESEAEDGSLIADGTMPEDDQVWEEVYPEDAMSGDGGSGFADDSQVVEDLYPEEDMQIVDDGGLEGDGGLTDDGPIDYGMTDGEMNPDDGYSYDFTEDMTPAEENNSTGTVVMDTALLSEQSRSMFEKAKAFCEGEYQGDSAQMMNAAAGDESYVYGTVLLDAATGMQLSQSVEEIYYTILRDGAGSYVPTGMEMYINSELNLLDQKLKNIFGMDGMGVGTGILSNVSDMDRQTLYDDTMHFFAKMYGESLDLDTDMAGGSEEPLADGDMSMDYSAEGGMDDMYSSDAYADYDVYGYDVY
ncbi:MAG: DUF1002 domain-containing protein [Blautia sp.]|nr:DUF1002 domain-containing protein [Blautia sp.]MDY5030688.1 DUF1002 domain-containing protein [Blautia sp.]